MRSYLFPITMLLGFGLMSCSGKGSDTSSGTDSDADTDTDSDTDTDTDTDADTCTTDICATYGSAVPLVAQQITEAAAGDSEFSPFFAPLVSEGDTAVSAFETNLADFISDAYGCSTGLYTGPDMATAHAGMGITQQEYDDFITLIAGVLSGDGVTDDDINYCFAPALTDTTFEASIIGK